ncbi:MAG: rubrerythrin [Kiritimatiellia bacterium]|jgi:rubrerythrin
MFAAIDFSTLDLMDALDLAVLIEIEAMERYKLFSNQLGYSFPGDAGSVFHHMANNEAKHGVELSQRRESLFGDAPVRVQKSALFDVEAPEVGAPRWDMSPLAAFEVAVSSERKAYAFYDQALPHVTNEEVRTLFVELRGEEQRHMDMLLTAMAKLPARAAEGLVDLDNDD